MKKSLLVLFLSVCKYSGINLIQLRINYVDTLQCTLNVLFVYNNEKQMGKMEFKVHPTIK